MSKLYSVGIHRNGVFENQHPNLQGLLNGLSDGTYLISFQRMAPKADIKDYRACYFAKIQMLGDEVGHTKQEMHEIVKEHVLIKMLNETPALFTELVLTTKALTDEGWIALLEQMDFWAWTEYHVILQ